MGHYQKLALIAFRLVGIAVFLLGIVSVGYSLLISRPASVAAAIVAALPALAYVVWGAILFGLSKFLAAIAAKHLDR